MASKQYRKEHKGRNKNTECRGCGLVYGTFGLRAITYERVTENQLKAAWTSALRPIKSICKMWQRVFATIPVTRKPAEVRMGSGKGSPEFKIFRMRPGRVIFEVQGVSEEQAREAFALASAKLPCRTEFIAQRGRVVMSV
jgi:large subunit ribosomal protein L16